MITSRRWNLSLAALLTAALLGACGGGDDSNGGTGAANLPAQEANAPAATGAVGLDGLNWINFRRAQAGVPQLQRNGLIDAAALNHSNYLRINDFPYLTHGETPGNPGFTGVDVPDRLNAAGYRFAPASYIYGEVIAASGDSTGASLAEQLMAAIYHRFLMLEPMFKEIGADAATDGSGYTYFTADFAANNGYGPGLGHGKLAGYPFDGQSNVPVNFFSDQEVPDPVPNQNEVGYPVSVHGDLAGSLQVQAFTLRPRGGANLAVRLLSAPDDPDTPRSAAAIVPLAVLAPNTTYDASFSGTVDGVGVTRNWSFTTR
ncbi:MAG: CAP domain-containing protein [Burkholderiaceae bacterium]|nr:CAP domain-containing protein [Burkholderiaceae bacterium]